MTVQEILDESSKMISDAIGYSGGIVYNLNDAVQYLEFVRKQARYFNELQKDCENDLINWVA